MTPKVPILTPPLAPETRLAGDFSLRYLLEILFRRKRIFFVTLILVPVLSLIISLLVKPSYLSTTTILLGKEDILNPLVRYETAVAMTDNNRLGSFEKIICSRPLIEETIRKLGLDKGLKSDRELERMVDRIRENIYLIGLTADSVQINCSAPDPVQAKDLVETIAHLFIEKSLQGSQRDAMAAVNLIQKELDRYQEDLDCTAGALQAFRQERAEPLQQLAGLGGQLHDDTARVQEVERELNLERLNEKLLTAQPTGEKPMALARLSAVQDTPYQRQYQELSLRMGNLMATRNKSHPEVRRLQREMDYTRELLENDSRIQIKVLEQKVEEFHRLAVETRAKLLAAPLLEREQARLESMVKLTRDICDNLRMKLEQARISREVEIEQQTHRFTIIDPPRVPLARYTPVRKNFVAAGVLGGVCLGFLIVFLLEFSEPRLVRPGDLIGRLGLPLIGVLPRLYRTGGPTSLAPPVWLSSPLGAVFGARRFVIPPSTPAGFLVSAARVQQEGVSSDPREGALDDFIERVRRVGIASRTAYEVPAGLVWLVASAKPGEGKTLLAANLGVVLASDLKQPVLLVDANLQRPDLSALFESVNAPGLGDVVDGRVALEGALVATATPHLSLLPAGRTTAYAEVLFNSMAFGRLLDQARERFAIVLIEAPDLTACSDGLLIAPQTDGVLLVSRLYATKQKEIEAAVRKLPREKIIGMVANCTEYWIPRWLYRWV